MTDAKIIQIVVAVVDGFDTLYALDKAGEVWVWSTPHKRWNHISSGGEGRCEGPAPKEPQEIELVDRDIAKLEAREPNHTGEDIWAAAALLTLRDRRAALANTPTMEEER